MITNYYKRFFKIFGENKKNFIKYSCVSFFVGILELFGVALTYPFVLKLLSNNDVKNIWASPLFIGLIIIALFVAKNVFMVFYSLWQAKFTKAVEAEMNLSFIRYFLTAPYQETSKISLAEKGNILGFLVPNTINNFILRLLNLSVNFFIFGLISLFLVIKFPLATIVTVICAVCLITVQNKIFKPILSKLSTKVSESSIIFNQKSNEVLLNIKGVKVSGNEKYFFENYKSAIKKFYEINARTQFLNVIPPYITEPFIIILLFVLLAIISYQQFANPERLVASFAVIVSAIFRLSPTISRIQVNLNGINSALPMVKELLETAEKLDVRNIKDLEVSNTECFDNYLELKNLNFGYDKDKLILKNINLRINKGEFIGIAGLSGVGKTTLIDLICGLLSPTSGEILVDGVAKNVTKLKFGYIPQEFVMANTSIRENVAFGYSEVDDERVIDALKKAQLYDFIIENYKEGIYANPFVDSNGFSRGQKQRIAIARALYSNPEVLVLDEATSSLDLKTEDEICNILYSLKNYKTIIVISHNLNNIKFADNIAFMQKGTNVDFAKFEDLYNRNSDFKELADISITLN